MRLQLSAIDTWFFRDSTPFDKEDSAQAGVVGLFPPYPPTIAGAIRAALARRRGWDGRSRWRHAELLQVLGDGPTDLGRLRVTGPFVLRAGVPLFPMPRHVLGRDEHGGWTPAALLRPGAPVVCDLEAEVRLPAIPEDRSSAATGSLGASSGLWVTLAGLRRILRGELPAAGDLAHERDLWRGEARVGIERAAGSRTIVESALYSARHVRPGPAVSLGVELDGLPASWPALDDAIPLGGESRLAACEAWHAGTTVGFDAPPQDARTVVVIALTPVLLEAAPPHAEIAIPGARIISACLDRALRIGGWDSQARAPLPLRNAAPAGTVWFCRLDDPAALHAAATNGLVRVGASTTLGFGLCAVGSAPHWETTP